MGVENREMIQQVKVFVIKPDDTILISWTYMIKGDSTFASCPITCVPQINKHNKIFFSEFSRNNNNNNDKMLVFKPFSANLLVVN